MHWHTTVQVETQLLKLIYFDTFATGILSPWSQSCQCSSSQPLLHGPFEEIWDILLRVLVLLTLKKKTLENNNSAIHFRVVCAGCYLKKNTEIESNISLTTHSYFFSLQWHSGFSSSASFKKERSHPCKAGRISTQSALNLPQSGGSTAQRPFSLLEGSLHHLRWPTSIN